MKQSPNTPAGRSQTLEQKKEELRMQKEQEKLQQSEQQSNPKPEPEKESMSENSSEPRIGFGAADNVEQDEFDREQLEMSKPQLRQQVEELVRLYKAEKYRRQSGKAAWDPNDPETEEDGIRAESLRRLKVRQMFKGRDRSPK